MAGAAAAAPPATDVRVQAPAPAPAPRQRAETESRTPGSEFILPANPLSNLTDDQLEGFIDCTLYEDTSNFHDTESSIDIRDALPPGIRERLATSDTLAPVDERRPFRSSTGQIIPIGPDSPWPGQVPGALLAAPPVTDPGVPPYARTPPPITIEPRRRSTPMPGALPPAGTRASGMGPAVDAPEIPPADPTQAAQATQAAYAADTLQASYGAETMQAMQAHATSPGASMYVSDAMQTPMPAAGIANGAGASFPRGATPVPLPGVQPAELAARPRSRPRPRRRWLAIAASAALVLAIAAVALVLTRSSSSPANGGPAVADGKPTAGGAGPKSTGTEQPSGVTGNAGSAGGGGGAASGSGGAGAAGGGAGAETGTADAEGGGVGAESGGADGDTDDPPGSVVGGLPVIGSGPCRLIITVTPAGSTVKADGAKIGVSPMVLDGPCERRRLDISHPRYAAVTRFVTPVLDKPESIEVTLVRPTHSLTIVTTPPGATISIEGRRAGTSPTVVQIMGFYGVKVTISKPGFKTITQRVYSKVKQDRLTVRMLETFGGR